MKRPIDLITGNYYHVFNKSIEGFKIFLNDNEYMRMLNTVRYYQRRGVEVPISRYLELSGNNQNEYDRQLMSSVGINGKLINIVAYCFMPTHLHFILEQLEDGGISRFMRLVLNSYARYFNNKHKRKGPLWVGRFKNVPVSTDEQLYHLTRYIHLNPVTANMLSKPELWKFSSYREYLNSKKDGTGICDFNHVLDIQPGEYGKFVGNYAGYQKELGLIKKIMLE